MNFIINLLILKNLIINVIYDLILVMINYFIKYSHLISFKKIYTLKQLNFIILNQFIRYHEILREITNDKNKFFTFNY